MSAVTMELPRVPESVRTARRLVGAQAGALDAQRRDDATLMVSELVTNALQHGIGTIFLRIDDDAVRLRIEVADEGQVAVQPTPTPGAHGGWGLRLVADLADEWGVLEGSTRVWFRLDHAPTAA